MCMSQFFMLTFIYISYFPFQPQTPPFCLHNSLGLIIFVRSASLWQRLVVQTINLRDTGWGEGLV